MTADALSAELERLLEGRIKGSRKRFNAVSLFSGAGLGDMGFALSGFRFRVQAELDPTRLAIANKNHPEAAGICGDIRNTWKDVVRHYRNSTVEDLHLLVGMSPCQGMSTTSVANWKRGDGKISEDPRNQLAHYIAKVANELKPRFVFYENVVGAGSTLIRHPDSGEVGTVLDLLTSDLPEYDAYVETIQMADYGIPQQRKRLLVIFARREMPVPSVPEGFTPFPRPSHSERPSSRVKPWISVSDFLAGRFAKLDAASPKTASDPTDPLHNVPVYKPQRYEMVRAIPPNSGASAFETELCPHCGSTGIEQTLAECPSCCEALYTRPIIDRAGRPSLIVGRRTSYRRMQPHRPATTVTTSSGRVGSDNKIHPWENRVLSPRECAALQTVPKSFKWESGDHPVGSSVVRECVGEAIPVWFTLQLGRNLAKLLDGNAADSKLMHA